MSHVETAGEVFVVEGKVSLVDRELDLEVEVINSTGCRSAFKYKPNQRQKSVSLAITGERQRKRKENSTVRRSAVDPVLKPIQPWQRPKPIVPILLLSTSSLASPLTAHVQPEKGVWTISSGWTGSGGSELISPRQEIPR